MVLQSVLGAFYVTPSVVKSLNSLQNGTLHLRGKNSCKEQKERCLIKETSLVGGWGVKKTMEMLWWHRVDLYLSYRLVYIAKWTMDQ